MPSISVIVPVYRAEDCLRRAVDSVLAQDHEDFELLLIDDGSPDASGALCDALAAEDDRIRVFHKENGGVSSARNLGLKEARGAYFAFLDADDWFAPRFLSCLYGQLQRGGADSAGCAHKKVFPEGGEALEPGALPEGLYESAQLREGIVYRLLGERLGAEGTVLNGFVWRFLFSAEIIRTEKLQFEGAYLEDELFLMEYFCHAKKLAMTDEALYYYLQNPQSVTRNYLPDYLRTYARFRELKEALVQKFALEQYKPLWRENSDWSSLLIAVGNEYAPGNPKSLADKTRAVKALCQRPEMQRALRAIAPQGLSRNKQLVASLLKKRLFGPLSLLYAVKNRGR